MTKSSCQKAADVHQAAATSPFGMAAEWCPCFQRERREFSSPCAVRGPVAPPCMRHLPLAIPGAWQGLPERLFAPQRGALRGSPGGFPFFSQIFSSLCSYSTMPTTIRISLGQARRFRGIVQHSLVFHIFPIDFVFLRFFPKNRKSRTSYRAWIPKRKLNGGRN
jgi:hypothetical protein